MKLAWIVVLLFTLTGCASGRPSTEQAEQAVQSASDRFFEARQRGDASAFAALFADDGIFMVPGLVDAAGRSAVQELAEKRFANGVSSDFEIHRREIDVVGDKAYEVGWFSETTADRSHRMQGRHLIVWQRASDGGWRVRRYLYSFSGAQPL